MTWYALRSILVTTTFESCDDTLRSIVGMAFQLCRLSNTHQRVVRRARDLRNEADVPISLYHVNSLSRRHINPMGLRAATLAPAETANSHARRRHVHGPNRIAGDQAISTCSSLTTWRVYIVDNVCETPPFRSCNRTVSKPSTVDSSRLVHVFQRARECGRLVLLDRECEEYVGSVEPHVNHHIQSHSATRFEFENARPSGCSKSTPSTKSSYETWRRTTISKSRNAPRRSLTRYTFGSWRRASTHTRHCSTSQRPRRQMPVELSRA